MNELTWIHTAYRTRLKLVRTVAWFLPLLLALTGGVGSRRAAAQAGDLQVAAATDMQPVFEAIGPIFEQRTGIKLKVAYGSSATLAQQIIAGSPMDIFFSADFYFAEKLVAANRTDGRTPEPYARGLLVVWAPKNSRFQPLSVDVLSRADLKTLAIADPDHAPYGRAAEAALRKMGLDRAVAGRIVKAESVAQAAQFALSGNADVAVISETIAMSPRYRDKGTFALFPISVYPEIRQTAVVLKASQRHAQAHRLLTFMLSDEVQENLPKLGLRSIH